MLLGSVAGALSLKGAYAPLPEKGTIRLVFERETDAATLAQALLPAARPAKAAGPGSGGWC